MSFWRNWYRYVNWVSWGEREQHYYTWHSESSSFSHTIEIDEHPLVQYRNRLPLSPTIYPIGDYSSANTWNNFRVGAKEIWSSTTSRWLWEQQLPVFQKWSSNKYTDTHSKIYLTFLALTPHHLLRLVTDLVELWANQSLSLCDPAPSKTILSSLQTTLHAILVVLAPLSSLPPTAPAHIPQSVHQSRLPCNAASPIWTVAPVLSSLEWISS
jgi:hypothetical protein